MNTKQRLAALAASGIVGIGALVLSGGPSEASGIVASARLRNQAGTTIGTVVFKRSDIGIVGEANVVLAPGTSFRGFHIHANDVDNNPVDGNPADGCVGDFTSVDGHWDVGGHSHGAHTGDLPVLMPNSAGRARTTFSVGAFKPSDIIGRAVVVHVNADNYANIPTRYVSPTSPPGGGADPTTLANGDGGARYGCGVIVRN
jgi:Cu-Zn family superoxide dismutase